MRQEPELSIKVRKSEKGKMGPKSETIEPSEGGTRLSALRGQSFGARCGGWIKCINILRREEAGGREEGERGDRYTDIQKNPGAVGEEGGGDLVGTR